MTQQHSPQRIVMMVAAIISLFSILSARLVEVQLMRGDEFLIQAEENRLFSQPLLPDRGVFLDRFGEPLAYNQRQYYYVSDPTALFARKRPITREEALPLLATASSQVVNDFKRHYPYPSLAHLLGYIAPVTEDDLTQRTDLELFDRVGRLGLEQVFDTALQGKKGSRMLEVTAQGEVVTVSKQEPAEAGVDIKTTLDPYLSEFIAAQLTDKKAAVVVLDAATGQVLSIVNSPAFDPNVFSPVSVDTAAKEERQQQITSWFKDERQPFFNRAIAGAYPPGSVFKLVTALAGLSEGVLDTSTTVIDEGVLKVGEYEYGNWYFRQYGRTEGEIGLIRSLARSNDIFFYKAAEWLTPDKLAQAARLMGFGAPTGIELKGEHSGTVPDPAWKEAIIGERWYLGNTYHFGIGQGDLLVTPLQVAGMAQIFGNTGERCQPTILASSQPKCSLLGYSDEDIETVLRGLFAACSPGGTAYPFFERNGARYQESMTAEQAFSAGAIACKTGTAEFGGSDSRGYRNTHGWWVGVVEPDLAQVETEFAVAADDEITSQISQLRQRWGELVRDHQYPRRLAIAVLVESDQETPYREGSRDAAPIGKAIVDWMEGKLVDVEQPVLPPANTLAE